MAFGKLLSDRVKKRKGSELDSERYDYISLDNAEPDFGNPSSANGLMSSTQYGTRRFIATSTGLEIDSDQQQILISDTGVSAGEYGTSNSSLTLTVNSQGQITNVSENSINGITAIEFTGTGQLNITTSDGTVHSVAINLTPYTTDDLAEGSTNLYYTDDRVRTAVSAAGDLSYDANTGIFSFDVEQVYTKANFDSDFNMAVDEASLGGVGLAYNATTNTLSIDSAELENYFKGDIRGYFSADKGLVYNSSTGNFDIDSANIRTLFSGGTGITYTPATGVYDITNTGVIADTYGSASQVPVLKINAQGQIDSAGTVTVAGVSSVVFDSASFNYTINTADGGVFTKMIHTRKPGLAAGEHGTASKIPIITVNEYGLVDSIGTTNVAGVTAFAWDSDTAQATITTADGGSFPATIRGYGHNVGLKFGGDDGHVILGKDATSGGGLSFDTYGNVHRPIRFKSIGNEKLRVSSLGIQVFNTNNTNVLETTAYGATVTGTINADSGTFDVVRPARLHTGLMTGPDTILIDPAAVGDATGTVRVLGNLIVEGTETTINSTVVSINDKAIVIADSAADSAGLNGGGIIWGGSNIVDKPSFKYNHTNARFNANRPISADLIGNVTGTVSTLSNFTTDDLNEGSSNEYYTKARVDSDIAASINDSDNVVNITINQTIGSVVDSAYVLARVEEAPFLDSNDLVSGISNIVSDSATFSKITVPPVSNGGIILQDSTGQALTISNRLQSNPLIEADAPLTIKNFYRTNFINTDGTIRATIGSSNGAAGRVVLYGPNQRPSFETTPYGAFIADKLVIGSSGAGGSELQVDSANIGMAMVGTPNIDDSDYVFAVSDIDSGGKKFAILAPGGVIPNFTMKGEGEQTFRFHNTNTDPSSTKRVSFKMANRSNSDWEWIMFTDVAGNGEESLQILGRSPGNNLLIKNGVVSTNGAISADSAQLVNLTLTGNVTGLRADSATIDNMVGTASNATLLNNEGPAYYLAYENFTGIPFVFDSNQTVEIVDSNLSFNGFALRDAVRGAFGTDRDLEIYHDNANAYIDNDKGHIFIRNNVDDDDGGNIVLQAKSGENGIIINDDGPVALYHDNGQKLVTTSAGVEIIGTLNTHTIPGGTGTLALTSDLNFIDSAMALAFLSTLDSSDVSTIVSETVTNSFVDALNVDADTLDGVQGSSFLRSDAADTKTSGDLTFNDGVNLAFGTDGDASIRFNGSNTIIQDTSGGTAHMEIQSNNSVRITSVNASKTNARFFPNAQVELYHDNSKKFETTDSGVEVTGAITADSANLQSIDLPERTVAGGAGEIRFGPQSSARGMKLYNDGSSGIIECQESTLELHGATQIRDDLGNKIIASFSEFSGVNLRDKSGNQTRLQTTVYGVDITGNLTTTDSAAINGPLSVSGLTSTSGLFSNGDIGNSQSAKGVYAGLSTAGDAQISLVGDNVDVSPQIDFSHDVNTDYDVRLILEDAGNRLAIKSGSNENMARFNGDGAVELYHDNSKKLETTKYGATVTGTLNADSATISGDITTTGSIHIGNVDTTLSRNAAGSLQIEGHTILHNSNANMPSVTSNANDASHILINSGGFLKRITPANLGIGAGGLDSAEVLTVAGTGSLTGVSGAFTAGGNITANLFNITNSTTASLQSFTATTTATTQFAAVSASTTGNGAMKIIVTAKRGSDRHVSEILATHDGTTAVATEYSMVTTNGILANYDVDINSGNLRFLITPTSATSTDFKTVVTFIGA